MSNIAYLSIGSNMGDRYQFLKKSLQLLDNHGNVTIEKVSSAYETDPVGYTDQAPFLNIAVKLSTELAPLELLRLCLSIEQELGRVREFRWGPRVIDLDIILYNRDCIDTEILQVPHPRMTDRAFVLIPLLEIDENLILPSTSIPLAQYLDAIPSKKGVRLWKQISGEDEFERFEN